MCQRCDCITNNHYHNYGERGIAVCEEWYSFELFYNWAIENDYSEELSIDRIDNDGNYEPGNCRWATRSEQQNNTRKTIRITINGITDTLLGWSKRTGLKLRMLQDRYHRGWHDERLIQGGDKCGKEKIC